MRKGKAKLINLKSQFHLHINRSNGQNIKIDMYISWIYLEMKNNDFIDFARIPFL